MIFENPLIASGIWFFIRVLLLIFVVIYFIFSLIIIRQVNLMTETVVTEVGGVLKILAIFHALLALAAVIFFVFSLL